MKKLFILTFFTSLFWLTTAFSAELPIKITSATEGGDNTITISANVASAYEGQAVSIMVSEYKNNTYDTGSIVYINRITPTFKNNSFTTSFQLSPQAKSNTNYIIRVGAEKVKQPSYVVIKYDESKPSFYYGDVDEDGKITSNDSSLVLQYVLSEDTVKLTEQQLLKAKVTTTSSRITANDSSYILSKALNLDLMFPIEK